MLLYVTGSLKYRWVASKSVVQSTRARIRFASNILARSRKPTAKQGTTPFLNIEVYISCAVNVAAPRKPSWERAFSGIPSSGSRDLFKGGDPLLMLFHSSTYRLVSHDLYSIVFNITPSRCGGRSTWASAPAGYEARPRPCPPRFLVEARVPHCVSISNSAQVLTPEWRMDSVTLIILWS
jgi:hypothetical protein